MSDVLEHLERLVAFPTVSNRPMLACAAHIADHFEGLGFRIERFMDPNDTEKCTVIASIGPPGTNGLMISGHLDVVPVEGQPWTTDPFVLTPRGDTVVARGSADMKGFIAACMVALSSIPPEQFRRELVLLWTHDEEIGCKGSAAFVDAVVANVERRIFPTDALIGEPTGFEILRMHPGHVAIEVDVPGLAAHSSRPDLGINAIESAAQVVQAVRSVAEELMAEPADIPELQRPIVAVNVAEICGGSAINIVPDHCQVRIGYRPLPGQDPEQVFRRIEARVAELDWRIAPSCRVLRVTPAMLTPRHTPLEHSLQPHACTSTPGAATFATDGGNLARLGIRPLVFGPGDINVAHKADEHVPVEHLNRAVGVVRALVMHHCCSDAK